MSKIVAKFFFSIHVFQRRQDLSFNHTFTEQAWSLAVNQYCAHYFTRNFQEGLLSVSGERMCTILVNSLEDYACPVKDWLGKVAALDMTPLC